MKKTIFIFILMLGFAVLFQGAYERIKFDVDDIIVSSMTTDGEGELIARDSG